MKKKAISYLWPFLVFLLVLATVLTFGFLFGAHPEFMTPLYLRIARILLVLCLSLLAIDLVVEFASPFFVSDATFNTAFVALGIFFVCFFSLDELPILEIVIADFSHNQVAITIFNIIQFASYLFACVFLFRFATSDLDRPVDRRFVWISRIVLLADFVLYLSLYWFHMEWIAVFVWLLISLVWAIFLATGIASDKKWTVTVALTILISLLLNTILLNESLSRAFPGTYLSGGLSSYASVLIPICFFFIYLAFVIRTTRYARDKAAVQARLDELQNIVLKNQISSHFLFNTLGVVKSLYRVSPSQGDLAMDLLSKLLRAYTTSDDKYLIPLEKELDLLSSYLELHNLKGGKKYTLLFNVDAYDYLVPSFSLQPLLENAIQHSKIEEKEDGFFEVDSFQEGEQYVLRFVDNGVGFDTKSIGRDSVGLRNTEQRFKILLGAKMSLDSKIGEGTTVTFLIPRDQSNSWGGDF